MNFSMGVCIAILLQGLRMFDFLKRILLPGGRSADGGALAATRCYEQALRLAAGGRPDEAATAYREALRCKPDFPEACANLGMLLSGLGQPREAEIMLRRAAKLAPAHDGIAASLRIFLSSKAPVWQFPMMNDSVRNAAYGSAIAKAVRRGDHVLEIGTGSGLLAMMAARCGARHVTTCEMLEALAESARGIIARNGFGSVISVIPEASTKLTILEDLGEPADVLISEIVASDLIGEGLLESFQDAAARLLKPHARIVPARAWIRGQLAGSAQIERYLRVGTVAGFDLEAFNEFSPVTLFPEDLGVTLDSYSDPFDVFEFDFEKQRDFPSAKKRLSATATRAGLCHGVLQWIRLQLCDGIELENSPGASSDRAGKGHWKPILHAFAQPVLVKPEQSVHLVATHDRRKLAIYEDRAAG
jgi:type III protein arginine methyltransferase